MTEVMADLNYLHISGSGPKGNVAVPTRIRDGRLFDNPGWETCGFDLKQHRSAVTDWGSEEQIEKIHYAEIARFARELTGCEHALVTGHILRNPEQLKIHQQLGPIRFVHSDFTETYGERIRDIYRAPGPLSENNRIALASAGITADDVIAARRLLIVQFWRNVGPVNMDLPIAFCDARTVSRDDMLPFPVENYAGGGFDFDAFSVTWPTQLAHEWYTFPELNADEVVVFRTFDSECVEQSRPFWTPHSAFQNPEPGKPSRYSIELRATCLFC